MRRTHIFKTVEMTDEYLEMAARAVDGGAVAVVPTDTVYGIGTGTFCEPSIEEIYRIKERPAGSPLQILTGTLAQAREVAVFSEAAEKLAAAYKAWKGEEITARRKGQSADARFCGAGPARTRKRVSCQPAGADESAPGVHQRQPARPARADGRADHFGNV